LEAAAGAAGLPGGVLVEGGAPGAGLPEVEELIPAQPVSIVENKKIKNHRNVLSKGRARMDHLGGNRKLAGSQPFEFKNAVPQLRLAV